MGIDLWVEEHGNLNPAQDKTQGSGFLGSSIPRFVGCPVAVHGSRFVGEPTTQAQELTNRISELRTSESRNPGTSEPRICEIAPLGRQIRVTEVMGGAMQLEGQETGSVMVAPRQSQVALTPREQQIASAIADGRSNRDIAARLGITEQTVKNHLTSIFEKVGVGNRLQLGLALVRRR
jgi:DNA-binding NarL/FixJ family response regulator